MPVNRNTFLVLLLCAVPLTVAWGADRLGFLDEPIEPRFQQSFSDQDDDDDDSWLFDDSYRFDDEDALEVAEEADVMEAETSDDAAIKDDGMVFIDQDLPDEEDDSLAVDTLPAEENASASNDSDASEEETIYFEESFDIEESVPTEKEIVETSENIMMEALVEEKPMANQQPDTKSKADKITEQTTAKLETFSIDFPEEEIRNIIRNVADLYNLNVVIPDSLIGMTSITLNNVTWQQVYRAVLEPVGFTYVMDGNIIKIVSATELESEQMETDIFPLRFAVAADAALALESMIDSNSGAKVAADGRTNSLIVTERPSRMAKIEELIKRLDREETQIMIEAKFVEIKNRDTKTLGIDWNSLGTSGSTFQLGNSLSTAGAVQGVPGRAFFKEEGGDTPVGQTASKRTDNVVFAAPDFRLILHALEADNDTRLIANPTVVTMNNTPATVSIVDQEPIPNYQYNSETGNFEISGFEYKDIGIVLNVTPNAKQDLITLNIKPEISSTTGTTTFSSGGSSGNVSIPQISLRATQSIVTIKSGYTLAIGGLVRSEYQNNDTRVPFLGYIPVVKRLFSYDNRILENKNVIAFVTATQIGYDGGMPEPITTPVQNISERQIYEMGLSEFEMYVDRPADAMEHKMKQIRKLRNEAYRSEYDERLGKELVEERSSTKKKRNRRNRIGRLY